ncbi:membrane protein insertase YidC [Erysipelothrix urinaevulpis]|uniref:membrane protein insertase YidC n=1 Tax=Erysipelothrix urinaevulpis TaxID=2683717 RepID=UPI0013587941|nr:membrane protein insertase YidC [Erysipelothrix urinaevulpis]
MTDLIVGPFSKFIEIVFNAILNFTDNYGVALVILSMVVNIILLPFYSFAEKIEKKEKNIQQKMKPKLDEFKSVYKGYELYLYTNNVYRLNNYRPAYALRGLVSLLIQVPFFMGAYAFLSNYTPFQGSSFLILKDLGNPDGLLVIGALTVNLLPFVMTIVNLASGYIYAKESGLNEKITIVVIALFFLVILYSSPSSLLLYWTCNNIFSLFKNMITHRKIEGEVI